MAVSHVIKIAAGNDVRSAMTEANMDGLESFLSGTVIGATIGTADAAGDPVHVANVQAFTSTAVMTGKELMQAWAEKISSPVGGVAGARAYYAENGENGQHVMHVEALRSEGLEPAVTCSIATPTFVPGT